MKKLYINIKSKFIHLMWKFRNDIIPVSDYVPNIGHRYVSYRVIERTTKHIHSGSRDIHCRVSRESRGY